MRNIILLILSIQSGQRGRSSTESTTWESRGSITLLLDRKGSKVGIPCLIGGSR
ncbi:hypothetical protein Syun_019304 [Stephania yunnanensis]|uniref:Uncharacterized protein n=1 Tax=Stephania yunnanensis TaxID=152371 RepID=A0AAP0NVT0_9MAGN